MNELSIIFDYLSFTIPLVIDNDYRISYENESFKLAVEIADKMGFGSDKVFKQERTANGYKYSWNIGEFIIFRGYGPINGAGYHTCQIELRGSACRELEENGFCDVLDLLIYAYMHYQANITRIDLAIDDYSGKYATIEKIEKKLLAGHYTTSFRAPHSRAGNKENGFTLYLGSKKSTQMLVIYDKLQERKKSGKVILYDFWTRYEMRFMHEKARALANYIILNNTLDINNVAFGLLREMLDIKEENNYDENHQSEAPTVIWWENFLNATAKLKLNGYVQKNESTILTKDFWLGDRLKKMLASIMLAYDKEFIGRIYTICLEGYAKLSQKDMYIIDKARKERKKEVWTSEKLFDFLKSIKAVLSPEDNDFLSQLDIESLKILEAIEKEKFNDK